jgi:hypothetical protein
MRGRKHSLRGMGMSFWKGALVLFLLVWASGVHGAVTPAVETTGAGNTPKEDRAVRGFYLAIQGYFRVPEPEIASLKEKGLSYEELPVVFFIAERSQTEAQRVMEMRLEGRTWTEIAYRLGLTPDVFYVPVIGNVTTAPYDHAYRGYSRRPKREWKTVSLTEKDVENLVNLRFISDNYRCPPERVIEMRAAGKTFLQINDAMRKTVDG